jgi:hypothetical protein
MGHTDWHGTEYQGLSLRFGKRSACYWKNAVVARTRKGGKGVHVFGMQLLYGTNGFSHKHCNRESCFSVIPKGDEEFGLSMLRSAGKGRVEV